ncbi:MAG: hypothetical protein ACRCSN_19005, partial [Dermatophilaceae bacterium]
MFTTSTIRRVTIGLASAGLVAGTLLQASAPAQAAGVCGANYNPVRSVNVDIIDGPRQTLSKISVQYNPD